jgi:hypothetical protein
VLVRNEIDDVGMSTLAQASTRNDSLEWLKLEWNNFGIVTLTSVAAIPKSNRELTLLERGGNSIGAEGVVSGDPGQCTDKQYPIDTAIPV